jgi:hypothetical protein
MGVAQMVRAVEKFDAVPICEFDTAGTSGTPYTRDEFRVLNVKGRRSRIRCVVDESIWNFLANSLEIDESEPLVEEVRDTQSLDLIKMGCWIARKTSRKSGLVSWVMEIIHSRGIDQKGHELLHVYRINGESAILSVLEEYGLDTSGRSLDSILPVCVLQDVFRRIGTRWVGAEPVCWLDISTCFTGVDFITYPVVTWEMPEAFDADTAWRWLMERIGSPLCPAQSRAKVLLASAAQLKFGCGYPTEYWNFAFPGQSTYDCMSIGTVRSSVDADKRFSQILEESCKTQQVYIDMANDEVRSSDSESEGE